MNNPRKFWLVLIGAVLAMVVIACSCGSLTPTPTAPPPPTIPVNPMPALAGYWLDTETNDVHTIAWQNGRYMVTATNDVDHGSFPVTDQSWNGSALTWTYKVSYNDTSVTFTTVSVNGDTLYTNWSNSDGKSGTQTLQRVSSPIPSAPVNQEPMPGLAGKWRDNAENNVHTIIWDGSKYVVVSTVDDNDGAYTVSKQSWDGSRLSWTYIVPSNGTTVDIWTVSVSGDNLDISWSSSNGGSGTDTFTREP